MRHPALQVAWCCRAGAGGGDEAAGLDEERGLLGVAQGLLEEGNGGVEGGTLTSKVGQGCLAVFVGECRVGASLEEKVDNDKSFVLVVSVAADVIKSCRAVKGAACSERDGAIVPKISRLAAKTPVALCARGRENFAHIVIVDD